MHHRDIANTTEETALAANVSRLVGYAFTAATAAAQSPLSSTTTASLPSTSSPLETTATPTSAPTSTLIKSSTPPTIYPVTGASINYNHISGDRTIAIVLAAVLGGLSFLFALCVFCCIWRRKRKTGLYLKRSPQPHASLAPTASEVDSWRRPRSSTLESIHPATGRADRHLRISTGGALATAAPTYPMRVKHRSRDSMEEEFPFFNQQHSRVDFARGVRHQPIRGAELDAYESSTEHLEQPPALFSEGSRRSSGSSRLDVRNFPFIDASQRPSTSSSPSRPAPLNVASSAPHQPSSSHARHAERAPVERLPTPPAPPNTQSSAFDYHAFADEHGFADEEDDHVSPILTPRFKAKSPEPGPSGNMVHYPSWSEVSEFDFAGSGERRSRNFRESTDSAETWRLGQLGRVPDSAVGRHELP